MEHTIQVKMYAWTELSLPGTPCTFESFGAMIDGSVLLHFQADLWWGWQLISDVEYAG